MDERMVPLEKLFLQVEEECERRAQGSQSIPALEADSTDEPIADIRPTLSTNSATCTRRRGGSVSVTRFGELSAPTDGKDSALSSFGSRVPFYQAQQAYDSFESFIVPSKYDDDDEEIKGDHLVTHVYNGSALGTISKAMSDLLPRRLSRSCSEQMISQATMEPPMVVGVHVEKATVEVATEDLEQLCRTTVHAPNSVRKRTSVLALSGSPTTTVANQTWVDKAKDLTQKFRQRSKTVLTPPA
ncbi:hypothetical protein APHAL10511_000660 [Amanita phalloides]|nr:hypothetical protein APHAL10511_000660 [Amanita phalloides]